MSRGAHTCIYTVFVLYLLFTQALIIGYSRINTDLQVTIDGLMQYCDEPPKEDRQEDTDPDLKEKYL